MTESFTDGLQSLAVALLRSPLKRLVIPAAVIFILVGVAGYFASFVGGPAPVSQYAALAAPPATEAMSTVGLARETDMRIVVDRLRPSDEDIVKAFQLATEDPGMVRRPSSLSTSGQLQGLSHFQRGDRRRAHD